MSTALIVAVLFLTFSASTAVVILRGSRALATEQRFADAERAKHIEVETAYRADIQNARALAQAAIEAERQQREIAGLAVDAAQAMTHDIARLIEALQHAALLIGGKPQDWKRVAPSYGCNPHLYSPASLKEAAIEHWHALIDEVQGATPASGHPSSPSAIDADDDADTALAVEALDTVGPGVSA